jgi:ammonia channel protein AmtB
MAGIFCNLAVHAVGSLLGNLLTGIFAKFE